MNKNVNVNWTLGNFSVSLSAELDEKQQDAAMQLGLLYLGQRISKVDKTLGGYTGTGKSAKRKVGWKRGEVGFSESLATALQSDFATLEFPQDGVAGLTPTAIVTEYVRDTSESKEITAAALAFLGKKESDDTLETWCAEKLDWTEDTHGEDGEFAPRLVALVIGKLKEVRAKIRAELAAKAEAAMD
jgi:hypothetical protein